MASRLLSAEDYYALYQVGCSLIRKGRAFFQEGWGVHIFWPCCEYCRQAHVHLMDSFRHRHIVYAELFSAAVAVTTVSQNSGCSCEADLGSPPCPICPIPQLAPQSRHFKICRIVLKSTALQWPRLKITFFKKGRRMERGRRFWSGSFRDLLVMQPDEQLYFYNWKKSIFL